MFRKTESPWNGHMRRRQGLHCPSDAPGNKKPRGLRTAVSRGTGARAFWLPYRLTHRLGRPPGAMSTPQKQQAPFQGAIACRHFTVSTG
ncbi:hypothetical protein ACP3TJ_00160 [Desulforudis sp. 1088]|uniref:hypothetical protein n=1 Tax=Desulforudis sp. 1088 TaxID=3416137 RepID=UPI0034855BC2